MPLNNQTSSAWPYIKAIANLLNIPGTKIGLSTLTSIQDDLSTDQLQEKILLAIDNISQNTQAIITRLAEEEKITASRASLLQASKKLAEEVYLKRLADKYLYADFKGIAQLQRLLSLPLDDIFVDLKVTPEEQEEIRNEKEKKLKEELETATDVQRLKILQSLEALDANSIEQSRPSARVPLGSALKNPGTYVLLGGPGTGKTTVVKRLARTFALGATTVQERYPELQWAFPIVIPITQFASERNGRTLYNFINDSLKSQIGETGAEAFTEHWLNGRVLLLLDGLDEVSNTAERISCARAIDEIASVLAKNKLIVSTRKIGYSICRLSTPVTHFTLLPFTKKDISTFVKQWYLALEKANKPETQDLTEAQNAAKALNSEIQRNASVTSLASNPLMLTIIALIKHQQVTLPERRVELYDVALRTLIHSWNLARSLSPIPCARSSASAEETREIWASIAYWMHATANREVSRDKLYEKLVATLVDDFDYPRHEATQAANSYLESASETSGLLEARGPSTFAFVHQSFQEYLAALFLARPASKAILKITEHKNDPRWHEVIRLAAGHLGVTAGEREILANLLDSLITQDAPLEFLLSNSLKIALGCLADQVKPRQKQIDSIIESTIDRIISNRYAESKSSLCEWLENVSISTSPGIESKILTLLDSSDWELRIEAIKLLISSKETSAAALSKIRQVYKSDSDADVKSAAAIFLWKNGTQNTSTAKSMLRIQTNYIGINLKNAPFDEKLREQYIKLASNKNAITAQKALSVLRNWPNNTEVTQLWESGTIHPSPGVRHVAADNLLRYHETKFIALLQAKLKENNPATSKDAMLENLARRRGTESLWQIIEEAAKDNNNETRRSVATILMEREEYNEKSIAMARKLVTDTDESTQLQAACYLFKAPQSSTEKNSTYATLVRIAQSENLKNRDAAIRFLSYNGYYKHYENHILAKLAPGTTFSPDAAEAAWIISQNGDTKETRSRLIEYLSDKKCIHEAMMALIRLGETEESRKDLLKLAADNDGQIRSNALYILTQWSYHPEKDTFFRKILNDLESFSAGQVIHALVLWSKGRKENATTLLKLLEVEFSEELFNLFFRTGSEACALSGVAEMELHTFFSKTPVSEIQRSFADSLFNIAWGKLTTTS